MGQELDLLRPELDEKTVPLAPSKRLGWFLAMKKPSKRSGRVGHLCHELLPLLSEGFSRFDVSRHLRSMGDIGLEPMTPSVSSWCSSQLS